MLQACASLKETFLTEIFENRDYRFFQNKSQDLFFVGKDHVHTDFFGTKLIK